jgi:hypothetical protein
MILPCEMKSVPVSIASSLTSTSLLTSTQQSYCQEELKGLTIKAMERKPLALSKPVGNRTSVTNSTSAPARSQKQSVNTAMSAKVVGNPAMERTTVWTGPNEIFGLQPRYLRHNLWENSSPLSPTTAEWSERARPLPGVPLSELSNPVVSKTITDNPDLFQITSPINVDVFQRLLKDHPNPAFVNSVCLGLREGFWPWADTLRDGYPSMHDES